MAESRKSDQPSSDGIPFLGDDLNHSIPLYNYNTWTQFSGMPTHTVSDNTNPQVHWETFSPGNPAFDQMYTNLDPNAEYLSQILTNIRNNPSDIETDPRLADQSLQGNSSFHAASREGQSLYAETLNSWTNMNNFDPFYPKDGPKAAQEPVENAQIRSKPSYSDIAKSLKDKPIQQNKEKEEMDPLKKKLPDPPVGKNYKQGKRRGSHLLKQHSKGHAPLSDHMESKVKPNSKYGLDRFDDMNKSEAGNLKSESVESIPLLTRKGSTSSVSSGTSGIEEIHLSKGPFSGVKKENSAPVQKKKLDGKQEKSQEAKPAEKAFFDPRRIFQQSKSTKDGSKSPTESTILNNGKPMGRSKSTSENHRKSSDYINNDLRDAKKKTNQPSSNKEAEKKENVPTGGGSKSDKKQRNSTAHTPTDPPPIRRKKNAKSPQHLFDQESVGKDTSNYLCRIHHVVLHYVA